MVLCAGFNYWSSVPRSRVPRTRKDRGQLAYYLVRKIPFLGISWEKLRLRFDKITNYGNLCVFRYINTKTVPMAPNQRPEWAKGALQQKSSRRRLQTTNGFSAFALSVVRILTTPRTKAGLVGRLILWLCCSRKHGASVLSVYLIALRLSVESFI